MAKVQPQQGENPRTTRVRQVILDAAVELFIDRGAEMVTASHISEATGVARTTIYRHWPEPFQLLLDTIDSLVAPHRPTTVTQDLEADLITALTSLRSRMAKRPFRQIFAALLGHPDRDRDFVAAQKRFVNGVLRPLNDILTAALDRGDLPPTIDVAQACAALAGPLFHQHIMLRENIDDQLITDTVHRFLAPCPEMS